MFIVNLSGLDSQENGSQWGLDQQDELSKLAARFKKQDDKEGLYLCALVEEQINRTQKTGGCRCQAMLYLGMALMHQAGADEGIAHILLPVLQDIIREAMSRKGLASQD